MNTVDLSLGLTPEEMNFLERITQNSQLTLITDSSSRETVDISHIVKPLQQSLQLLSNKDGIKKELVESMGLVQTPQGYDFGPRLKSVKDSFQTANEEINNIKSKIGNISSEIEELRKSNENVEKQLNRLQENMKTMEQELSGLIEISDNIKLKIDKIKGIFHVVLNTTSLVINGVMFINKNLKSIAISGSALAALIAGYNFFPGATKTSIFVAALGTLIILKINEKNQKNEEIMYSIDP